MAMIAENWVIMSVITLVSLLANWYYGGRGRRLLWIGAGIVASLGLAIVRFELGWTDMTTATLAYGVLVIYCPLIWLVAVDKLEEDGVEKGPVAGDAVHH